MKIKSDNKKNSNTHKTKNQKRIAGGINHLGRMFKKANSFYIEFCPPLVINLKFGNCNQRKQKKNYGNIDLVDNKKIFSVKKSKERQTNKSKREKITYHGGIKVNGFPESGYAFPEINSPHLTYIIQKKNASADKKENQPEQILTEK